MNSKDISSSFCDRVLENSYLYMIFLQAGISKNIFFGNFSKDDTSRAKDFTNIKWCKINNLATHFCNFALKLLSKSNEAQKQLHKVFNFSPSQK